jgi:hypothetical protein
VPTHHSWAGGEGDFDLVVSCLGSRQVPAFVAASGWEDKLDNGGWLFRVK